MSTSLTDWGTWDDTASAQDEAAAAKLTEREDFKFPVGTTGMRPLPPIGDSSSPFVVVQQHWYTNTQGQRRVVLCLGKGCPVCGAIARAMRSGLGLDTSVFKDVSAKPKAFCLALIRQPDGEYSTKPRVVALPFRSVYQRMLQIRRDPDIGGDFTHPMTGFDLLVKRTGTGARDTEYVVDASRRVCALPPLSELEAMPDLDKYAEPPTPAELREAVDAIAGPQPARGMHDATPPPQRLAGSTAQKARGEGCVAV